MKCNEIDDNDDDGNDDNDRSSNSSDDNDDDDNRNSTSRSEVILNGIQAWCRGGSKGDPEVIPELAQRDIQKVIRK